MSNVLKCNVCNIVIDEMLSYIQNKISVIDENTLVRIYISAFTSEDIKQSKSLLFDSLPTGQRKIQRKNKGKELRDLDDIISLFKSSDPDEIPVFVARKLEKLPPITFDHLDYTKLLKDLTRLQYEIDHVKSSYATSQALDELRMDVHNLKYASLPPSPVCKVNTKRGAWGADSGPMGFSHCLNPSLEETNTHITTNFSLVQENDEDFRNKSRNHNGLQNNNSYNSG